MMVAMSTRSKMLHVSLVTGIAMHVMRRSVGNPQRKHMQPIVTKPSVATTPISLAAMHRMAQLLKEQLLLVELLARVQAILQSLLLVVGVPSKVQPLRMHLLHFQLLQVLRLRVHPMRCPHLLVLFQHNRLQLAALLQHWSHRLSLQLLQLQLMTSGMVAAS